MGISQIETCDRVMISDLVVKNFKSIMDSGKIHLRPLSIIAGANSSGKSNILESIAFVAQSTRSSKELKTMSQLVRNGAYLSYPMIASIAFRKNLEHEMTFSFSFPLSDTERIRLGSRTGKIGYELSYTPKTYQTAQTIFVGDKVFIKTLYCLTDEGPGSSFVYPGFLKEYTPSYDALFVLDSDIFNPLKTSIPDRQRFPIGNRLRIAREISDIIFEKMSRTFYISAMRGSIPLKGNAQGVPQWVGKNGENLMSLLSMTFSKREFSPIAEKIRFWAERFGLGSLQGGWWGNDEIGVDFEDSVLKQPLELFLASYGTRQILSLITQIFWSKEGDTLLIEEPEMSMHPESQITLQELFAEAVAEGKQIICTTHSPFLLLALSSMVKKGKISSKEITVLHTEKREDGTKISELPVDDKGLIKGWIPSFAKAESKLLDDIGDPFEE